MNYSRVIASIICFATLPFLVACQQKQDPAVAAADRYVKQIEESYKNSGQQDKLQRALFTRPVTYTAFNLRNPFELPSSVKNSKRYANVILPNVALDSLKLAGVIKEGKEWRAIFRANNGKIYHAEVGSRVGLQQALLTQITEHQVRFKIEVEAGKETETQEVVMSIQESKK